MKVFVEFSHRFGGIEFRGVMSPIVRFIGVFSAERGISRRVAFCCSVTVAVVVRSTGYVNLYRSEADIFLILLCVSFFVEAII